MSNKKLFLLQVRTIFFHFGLLLIALSLGIILLFLFLSSKQYAAEQIAPSVDGVSVPGPSTTLNPGVAIVLDPSESEAIKQAVNDLSRDLESVLGKQSPIVSSIPAASSIIVAYSGNTSVKDSTLTGEEAHQVSIKTIDGVNHAVLEGSDLRGTIYAIYTFSDKVVGVPPLWYWMGWQPAKKTSLQISQNSGIRVGIPQVKYRAWMLNNQDLWSGWVPSEDKYEILFETMLRLKLNTFYIGEQIGEYGGPWLDIAQKAQGRGLTLVANNLAQFRQWDKYWKEVRGLSSSPSLTLANADKFEDFWRYSLEFAQNNK